MFCTRCGKENNAGSRFCSGCGAELESVVENTIAKVQNSISIESVDNSSSKVYFSKNETFSAHVEAKNHIPIFLWIGITVILVVVAVLITVLVTSSGSSEKLYNEKIDLGRKYLLELNYEQAILCFKDAIKIDPKNKDAYIELAEAYVKNGEAEKAVEILKTAEVELENKKDREKVEAKKKEIEDDKISGNAKPEDNLTDIPDISAPEPTSTPIPTPIPTATATPSPTPTPVLMFNPSEVKTGDIIKFGSYEQDNNFENGKEPIEWIVLSKENDKVLLLSKYGLDCCGNDVLFRWQDCYLEKWLNDSFYNQAFSDEEKEFIKKTKLSNINYMGTVLSVSNDYIFCLSFDDVTNTKYGFSEYLMDNDIKRRCSPTAYAISRGVTTWDGSQTEEGKGTCEWWLRYSGEGTTGELLCIMDFYGSLLAWGDTTGDSENDVSYGLSTAVRPALYINLNP